MMFGGGGSVKINVTDKLLPISGNRVSRTANNLGLPADKPPEVDML